MRTDQQASGNEAGEPETEERERHSRLTRYADYGDFTFYYTDSIDEFPRGPIEISVGGRVRESYARLGRDWRYAY